MTVPQNQNNEFGLFIGKLNEVTKTLHALARDVQRDAEALAALRTELRITTDNFADLAKLVRNGSTESLTHRLTKLETNIEMLVSEQGDRKKSIRTIMFVLFAGVLGASLPFILDLVDRVLRHAVG